MINDSGLLFGDHPVYRKKRTVIFHSEDGLKGNKICGLNRNLTKKHEG